MICTCVMYLPIFYSKSDIWEKIDIDLLQGTVIHYWILYDMNDAVLLYLEQFFTRGAVGVLEDSKD